MIRQTLKVEIDWNINKKDKGLFQSVQDAILNESLKSFTGIYQAKVTTNGRVLLSVFRPSIAMKTNLKRLKRLREGIKKGGSNSGLHTSAPASPEPMGIRTAYVPRPLPALKKKKRK